MNQRVLKAIIELGNIEAKDLDDCSVEDLAQFHYWLQKHQGSLFIKTVGRLAVLVERMQP